MRKQKIKQTGRRHILLVTSLFFVGRGKKGELNSVQWRRGKEDSLKGSLETISKTESNRYTKSLRRRQFLAFNQRNLCCVWSHCSRSSLTL